MSRTSAALIRCTRAGRTEAIPLFAHIAEFPPASEDECFALLVDARWFAGLRCAHCDSDQVGGLTSGTRQIWNCKACHRQFTLRVGTILEDSPLPLLTWVSAIRLLTLADYQIGAYALALALHVSQKTAWAVKNRLLLAHHAGTWLTASRVPRGT